MFKNIVRIFEAEILKIFFDIFKYLLLKEHSASAQKLNVLIEKKVYLWSLQAEILGTASFHD